MDASDGDRTGQTDRFEDATEGSWQARIGHLESIDDEQTLCAAIQLVLEEAATNDVDVTGRRFLHRDDGTAWSVDVRETHSADSRVVPDDATVLETVAMTVADRRGVSPVDLPPLYDVVDPDLLESVGSDRTSDQVTFEYVGFQITVESDGSIHVAE